MKTKLLTICLLLFTSQVFAENRFNWTHIVTSDDGFKFYADKNSIRKNKSGNYIVWMLDNTSEGYSLIGSEEYDCSNLRYRLVYSELYKNHYGKGEKISSFDTEQLKSIGKYYWVYPTPNTPNDHKVNWVCRN